MERREANSEEWSGTDNAQQYHWTDAAERTTLGSCSNLRRESSKAKGEIENDLVKACLLYTSRCV